MISPIRFWLLKGLGIGIHGLPIKSWMITQHLTMALVTIKIRHSLVTSDLSSNLAKSNKKCGESFVI